MPHCVVCSTIIQYCTEYYSTSVLFVVQFGTSCASSSGWWGKRCPVYINNYAGRWLSVVSWQYGLVALHATLHHADTHHCGLSIYINFTRFCRAMLNKRGLSRHAVFVRPSVCHVRTFC